MGCAHKQNQHGFTLVEISIVMIIIGLLIGGTFGGMKLIENMQISKTVQDLKAIESAALTFKDTYGRLPGDMPNTAARLPSCTDAPCATGGDGNRVIGASNLWTGAIANTSENFAFWHHVQAANLLSMGYKNTLVMDFGEGQPDAPSGGGYRISSHTATSSDGCRKLDRAMTLIQNLPDVVIPAGTVQCSFLESVDRKFDDGLPLTGQFFASWMTTGGLCAAAAACTSNYNQTALGFGVYDLRGF